MTTQTTENPNKTKPLRLWNVIVHNDDINTYEHVIISFMQILNLEPQIALVKTIEVDKEGLSVVATTHKEHAELLQEQLQTKNLTVTIETT
jgi:ATP-dependent Clp protease adapter protein ClpS